MIKQVYHGTDRVTAQNIVNKPNYIDRTKGGGELGMGFYVGDSEAIAAAFAKSKFNFSGEVIEFDMNKSDFIKLDIHLVKRREKVYLLWRKIISMKKRLLYMFNKDVIVAPFATIDICMQYKFESQKGEDFINSCPKRIL